MDLKIIAKQESIEFGVPDGSAVKSPPAMQKLQEIQVQFLGWEDPLEEGTVTHSSVLAQRIPWTEEPGRLQSIGSKESDMTEVTEPASNKIELNSLIYHLFFCASCLYMLKTISC